MAAWLLDLHLASSPPQQPMAPIQHCPAESARPWGTVAVCLLAAAAARGDGVDAVRPFLARHCQACHGPDTQENEVRFDTLSGELTDPTVLAIWQEALDEINKGSMPPAEEPRPPAAEIERMSEDLGAILREAYASAYRTGGNAIVRRLNRDELRNTLRDLLFLDGPDYRGPTGPRLEDLNGNGVAVNTTRGPLRAFPADEQIHGFDTIGGQLVMSDFFLQLMFGVAEESLTLATHDGPRPRAETLRFTSPMWRKDAGQLEAAARAADLGYDLLVRRPNQDFRDRLVPEPILGKGLGVGARYRITIDASGHNRGEAWGELLPTAAEPLRVGLHVQDARPGTGVADVPLAEWDLPDNGSVRTLVHETWLNPRDQPWVSWENGPEMKKLPAWRLVERYRPEAFRPRPGKDASKAERQQYEHDMAAALLAGGYGGPHVRIHAITIEPLVEAWPRRGHAWLYGANGTEAIDGLILRFARRAFRQPVTAADVRTYVELATGRIAAGVPRNTALRDVYTAMLVSPNFLYIESGSGAEPLEPHRLAERLSYFLWSSMPDDELFALADSGRITEPDVLREQVERMLAHENAEEFVRRFVDRWLRLDKLGKMPPEKKGPFGVYWTVQLEPLMRIEAERYFADLLERDGPIRELVESDHTFVNEPLATAIYGRADVTGTGFRRVTLGDRRRGGVVTMPAVLTATANGVDTTPVVRGVWVLESVLGSPPSPAPPNVPPLAPDLRNATTIREQLAAHRSDAACASCHRKIDPFGFPLENFDPIGRWREMYPVMVRRPGARPLPIDPSATLPDGTAVDDVAAFRAALGERELELTRGLCEKLLTYGTGRLMEPGDRGELDRIVARLQADGGGLRSLVHLVVQSRLFTGRP